MGTKKGHKDQTKELRRAPDGTLMKKADLPGSEDNPDRNPDGSWKKGNKRATGRPVGARWFKIMNRDHESPPTPLDYKLAAKAVPCEPKEVPRFEKIIELLSWVATRAAIGGNSNAVAAVLDRVFPKPRRIEIDATITRRPPIAAAEGVGAGEANDYYERMGAELPDESDEPGEPVGGNDGEDEDE